MYTHILYLFSRSEKQLPLCLSPEVAKVAKVAKVGKVGKVVEIEISAWRRRRRRSMKLPNVIVQFRLRTVARPA